MSAGLTIAPEVFARLPGMRVVVVVADGLSCSRPEEVDRAWSAAWARVHSDFGHDNPQSHPHIATWRVAMRGIGASHKEFPTSVEALVRRALKSPAPFRVNPVVDFYNSVSLQHVVPAGGYDLDALDRAGLELRVTRAGDTFQALDASAPEPVPAGEVAYTSGSTVLTRHLVWRQSREALISPATGRALLLSEILPSQEGMAEVVRHALVAGAQSLFSARVDSVVLSATVPAFSRPPAPA
jgi:DNA/RNA-binding domain of Phe-tRNA-synthetase-like protein